MEGERTERLAAGSDPIPAQRGTHPVHGKGTITGVHGDFVRFRRDDRVPTGEGDKLVKPGEITPEKQ